MKRLILTTDHTGSGCLKQAMANIVGRKVFPIAHRLVCGRPPTPSETETFFEANHSGEVGWPPNRWCGAGPGLIDTCADFDTVELWIDPDPNAQLVLLQLLDFFRPHAEIVRKLILFQADSPIAERSGSDEIESWMPQPCKIDLYHLETAERAWRAFRQPTPEAWFDLLAQDIAALPYLRQTVLSLLGELPAVGTALGTTEAIFLKLISPGDVQPRYVFPGDGHKNHLRVFQYWEVGRLLDWLANCPVPAVLGLEEGPFDLAMHDNRQRHQRYNNSKLSLSDLGRALVEERDDFSRHNPIHRWWGGTELTNDRLWRWDTTNKVLYRPH